MKWITAGDARLPLRGPAFLFIGPCAGAEPELLHHPLPGSPAFRPLLVQERRGARRSATLGQRAYHQHVLVRTLPTAYLVAWAQQLGGLGPLAVDFYLSACHRLARERPGLVEPGRPEPLIDSNPVNVVHYK